MAHIAIIGANIGGLPAAYEIQEMLQKDTPGDHKVTVVSNVADFSFVPSNPWVAVGWRKRENTGFSLKTPLRKQGKWVHWMKIAFEKYFLFNIKRGSTEPLFQKFAFRIMGLNRLKD